MVLAVVVKVVMDRCAQNYDPVLLNFCIIHGGDDILPKLNNIRKEEEEHEGRIPIEKDSPRAGIID